MSKTKFLERFESSGLNVPDHVWDKTIIDDINNDNDGVFSSSRIKSHHIDIGIKHHKTSMRLYAIKHPDTTPEQLEGAIHDSNWTIRRCIAKHKNATPSQLDRLITDRNSFVRAGVVENPNTTIDYVNKGRFDIDEYVRDTSNRVFYKMNKV